METVLLYHIKKLYDNELYSSIIPLSSFLHTIYKSDRSSTTKEQEYQLLLFEANAHYYEQKYRLAIEFFNEAIILRKSLARQKNPELASVESFSIHFNDIESKYRLAICHRELRESKFAISALTSIPSKMRPPKVNMLLARMCNYSLSSSTSEAVPHYKEVLRECPLALDAIRSLLEIGVDGIEVNSLIVNASSSPKSIEWLNSWIKGHAQMFGRKHLEAATTFKSIHETTTLRQNVHILSLIGHAYYYNGNNEIAMQYLEMAHQARPHMTDPIMPLSVIYAKRGKTPELEKLASTPVVLKEISSEHWFALAQCLCAAGKFDKSSYFTHKAISMDPRNAEAFLLRGKLFHDMKRYNDAIPYFQNAQSLAGYRFEVYKGLFACYIGLKRLKDAQNMCTLSTKYFKNSPRSSVLLARTLLLSTSQSIRNQAKHHIRKALEVDEFYFPAVAALSEIVAAEGDTQEAIRLLKKQLTVYPNGKLYTMLGDIYRKEKDLDSALEQYATALSIDPKNKRALEGVNALGQSRVGTKPDDSSLAATSSQDEEWPSEYDDPSIDAGDFATASVDNNDGESGSETIWSDVDADINN